MTSLSKTLIHCRAETVVSVLDNRICLAFSLPTRKREELGNTPISINITNPINICRGEGGEEWWAFKLGAAFKKCRGRGEETGRPLGSSGPQNLFLDFSYRVSQ